jgi:hypothetical protein
MTDENQKCPLCAATLEKKFRVFEHLQHIDTVGWLQCPTPFAWQVLYKYIVISHFIKDPHSEHIYLPPFKIDNWLEGSNQPGESWLHKLVEIDFAKDVGFYKIEEPPVYAKINDTITFKEWKLIKKFPLMKIESSEKMLERINLLLKFL